MNAINILTTNAGNILRFLKEFTTGTARDVSITHINADGTTNARTFPNIAKMVATYNITNDNGTIRDLSGNILMDKIYTETKTITCKANIPTEVFNFGSLQNVLSSTFIIEISWADANNLSKHTRIWRGGVAGIFHSKCKSYSWC